MRLLLLLLALAVSASGCTRTKYVVETQVVEVPVPVPVLCPEPPEVFRPPLPIAALDSTASPGEAARAYVATIVALKGYAKQLEALLDGYRKPASDTLQTTR